MYETMSDAIAGFEADLDDGYGFILGRWTVGDIMRKLDPIMYREEFYGWLDSHGIDLDDLEDDAELP